MSLRLLACLFSLGWGNHWESSVGKTVWETSITSIPSVETSIRKTSIETSIRKASSITTISKSMKTSISMSSIRISSIGIRISSSSNKRSWCRDLMDRGSFLQGSKTSISGIIKSSLESSLCSSNLVNISKICSSNLSSLGICIHWSKSSMLSSYSSSKSSVELSLGCSNISCVFNWEGSGKSQKGSNDQFIHVCAYSRESSE